MWIHGRVKVCLCDGRAWVFLCLVVFRLFFMDVPRCLLLSRFSLLGLAAAATRVGPWSPRFATGNRLKFVGNALEQAFGLVVVTLFATFADNF